MKALTVRQPWAWAIARGGKHVENRSPAMAQRLRGVRGDLLIHAGAAWSTRGQGDERVRDAWYRNVPGPNGLNRPVTVAGLLVHDTMSRPDPGHRIEFGAFVAVVELVDVHPDADCCRPWGESEYHHADGHLVHGVTHLVFDNVRPIDVSPCLPGRLGLWNVPPDIAEYVID